jgi:WD40 repeat protein
MNDPLRIVSSSGTVVLEGPAMRAVSAAAFSPNARSLGICSRGALELYDVDTGTLVARFGEHDDEEGDTYSSIAVSDDGMTVVSGSLAGRRSFVWDATTGERRQRVHATLVTLNPSGLVLAAMGEDAWTFDPATGTRVDLPSGAHDVSTPPRVSSDGSVNQRTLALRFSRFNTTVAALALSNDGLLAAIGTSQWTLVCALPDGESLYAFLTGTDSLEFGPRLLGGIGHEGTILAPMPAFDEILAVAERRVRDTVSHDDRRRFGL